MRRTLPSALALALAALGLAALAAASGGDDPDRWQAVRDVLDRGVADGVYPGASALVGGRSGPLFSYATGTLVTAGATPPAGPNRPVTPATPYDLASLSKVVATTAVAAVLYELGLLGLNERLASPTLLGVAFAAGGKENVTVADCLLHEAGFPPDPSPNFWDPAFGCDGAPLPTVQTFKCVPRCFDGVLSQPLDRAPGIAYVYSDLSMISLMFAMGRRIMARFEYPHAHAHARGMACPSTQGALAYQCHFEAFFASVVVPRIEAAVGRRLAFIGYRPLVTSTRRGEGGGGGGGGGGQGVGDGIDAATIAPTVVPAQEGVNVTLQGRVNDGNCEMLGGVSGHAGVFASADALAGVMHAWTFPGTTMDGLPSATTFVNRTTVALFTTMHDPAISSRAYGWNTNADVSPDAGWDHACGALSQQTFMHLGYTGTMACCDPASGVYAILLTNRVYPTDQGHGIHDVRECFGTQVAKVINNGDQ